MPLLTSLLTLAVAAAVAAVPLPPDQDAPRKWLNVLPENITFSCEGLVPGYYADVESGCQMYHMCDPQSRRYSYLCPALTEFNQFYMTCVQHERVNCSMSEKFFHMNEMIGKPRMRFHSLHREEHSKKKDVEGSKADNHVESPGPAGRLLFEFETKLERPLQKLRPRLRPRQRPGGATHAAPSQPRKSSSPAPEKAGSQGAKPAARRRRPAAPSEAPRVAAGQAAENGTATGAGRGTASTTARPAAAGRGTAATSAPRAGAAPRRRLPLASTTAAPAAGRRPLFGERTAQRAAAAATPESAPRPRPADRAASAGAKNRTSAGPAGRVKPRARLTDVEAARPAAEAAQDQQDSALPSNTFRTFGLPGSFVFGTAVQSETPAAAARGTTVETTPAPAGKARPRPTAQALRTSQAAATTPRPATTRAAAKSTVAKTTTAPRRTTPQRTKTKQTTRRPTTTQRTTTEPITVRRATAKPTTERSTTPKPTTPRRTTPTHTKPRRTTPTPTALRRTTPKPTVPRSATTKPAAPRRTTPGLTTPEQTTPRSASPRSTLPSRAARRRTAEQTTPRPTVEPRTTPERSTARRTSATRTTPEPKTTRTSSRRTHNETDETREAVKSSRNSSSVVAKQLPPEDEMEALKLSFRIEPPRFALREDGPHEERKMKIRGELITGEMALRKMMVEQLKPVYFPSLKVPLNLLPPLLSNHAAPDGGLMTTLTLPVRRRRPGNSLRLEVSSPGQLAPVTFDHLVPPTGTTPAPPTAPTPASSVKATAAPTQRPTVRPAKDPAGLTMKFGKKKKGFRVGGSHGSKGDVCYPCMKSFIKDLENCHPCVVIR